MQLLIADFSDSQVTCFRNTVYTEQANTKPAGGNKLSDGVTFHIWGLKTLSLLGFFSAGVSCRLAGLICPRSCACEKPREG